MISLEIDKIKKEIPNDWNELISDEVRYIAQRFNIWSITPSNDTEQQLNFLFKFRFVAKIFRVKFWQFHLQYKLSKANKEQVILLADLANFIFPINKISLIKNPLPVIRIFSSEFYGPGDLIKNISLQEFAFADKAFTNFLKTADAKEKEQQLTRLVSCLYRPIKKDITIDLNFTGDNRQEFNSYVLDSFDNKFKKIPLVEKLMVLMFYWGCRNKLVDLYPNVFSKGNKSKATANDLGWVGVIFELGGPVIGTIDQVAQKNMHYMLTYLENELIKAKSKKPLKN